VTMRMIAERLLPDGAGSTYVDHEIVNGKRLPLKPPRSRFHVFCSPLNPGALEMMVEVSLQCKFEMLLEEAAPGSITDELHVTTNTEHLGECDHVLLYLNGQTWTRGEASTSFCDELMRAMDLNVHVLLAHEMPGRGGQTQRFAVEFAAFFGHPDGATPPALLARGIYSEIAVPLKGGAWREASMVLFGMALGMSEEERATVTQFEDILRISTAVREKTARQARSISRAMLCCSQPTATATATQRSSISAMPSTTRAVRSSEVSRVSASAVARASPLEIQIASATQTPPDSPASSND